MSDGDLISNYFKYKNLQKEGTRNRPVMKGSAFENNEVKKGVNVMGHMNQGINLARFQETLNKLKEHSKMRVNSASPDVVKNYQQILQTMGVASGTANYDTLSQMIATTFNDTKPFPGTIGGSISGCHVQFKDAHIVDEGCTPSCAGALKASNESNICKHKVYIAAPDGKGGFDIDNTFSIKGKGNAYIYVPRSKDRKFYQPNFDTRTLDFLKKDEVENVRFIGYDALNSVIVSINDEFIPIDSLYPKKARNLQAKEKEVVRSVKGESEPWDMKTIFIIGLIFLIIIGYIYFSKST